MYNIRPSEYADIVDPYTAYCFDEACGVISQRMQNGENPNFAQFSEQPTYTSFSAMYKSMDLVTREGVPLG